MKKWTDVLNLKRKEKEKYQKERIFETIKCKSKVQEEEPNFKF